MEPAASPYVAGVDVGGTGIKAGLFCPGPRAGLDLRLEFRVPTPRAEGPDAIVAAVLGAVTSAVDRGVRRFGAGPAAVGLAVLGLIDEAAGVATASAATGWRDVPLRALVQRTAGVPVGFGHDLRAAAMAEARLGAGRGVDSFLFVALGTGIGSALVLNGVPLAAAHGRAGEIGHIPVRGHDDPCPCGAAGCLETVASARSIADRYTRRLGWAPGVPVGPGGAGSGGPASGGPASGGPASGGPASGGPASGGPVTAAEVADLVEQGDPDAVAVWTEAVEALAEVLAGCVAMVDPAAIVVGGGLARSGELLLAPLRAALAARVAFGPPPPVTAAALGDRAALVGAGLLAMDALNGFDGGRRAESDQTGVGR